MFPQALTFSLHYLFTVHAQYVRLYGYSTGLTATFPITHWYISAGIAFYSFLNFTHVSASFEDFKNINFQFSIFIHSTCLICFRLTATLPITLLYISAGIALINLVIADFSS